MREAKIGEDGKARWVVEESEVTRGWEGKVGRGGKRGYERMGRPGG